MRGKATHSVISQCGGPRQLSRISGPSIIWGPGIELTMSGLMAGTLTHWAVSLAHYHLIFGDMVAYWTQSSPSRPGWLLNTAEQWVSWLFLAPPPPSALGCTYEPQNTPFKNKKQNMGSRDLNPDLRACMAGTFLAAIVPALYQGRFLMKMVPPYGLRAGKVWQNLA